MASALAPDKQFISSIQKPDNRAFILGFDVDTMRDFLKSLGEKPFRATQIIKWLHQHKTIDFNQMLNLSKDLRERLKTTAQIDIPEVIADNHSADGTRKWLFRLSDGNSIETVFIPTDTRGTLCISSQVGCALNCSFCYTAVQGYNRNLSAGEIIAQVWLAGKLIAADINSGFNKITNVVFMGMGEPLLNFTPVVQCLNLLFDDNAYGLSKRKVTLSTSGVVPMMYQLRDTVDVSLAVSLHAPNDKIRNELVPINQKYPIAELMTACGAFIKERQKSHVTFEYVMLAGVNDQICHAKELINVIQNVPNKVNLIPFNPFKNSQYQTSSPEVVAAFQAKLMSAGINTIVRRTRGEDIDAACGQLAGKIADRTRRSAKKHSV